MKTHSINKFKDFDHEISSLEQFFKTTEIPIGFIYDSCQKITDPKKFIEVHFTTIKNNPNKPFILAYIQRLSKIIDLLS